jgi:MoxR-like ATPase
MAAFADQAAKITASVGQALQGKPEAIRLALVALLAEGHVLIEDVPGVGKTTLARAIAASLDASWNRVQFTPDLLPSDVTGGTVYHQNTSTFEFHRGPVFANIVLADEINRASPKTQSALLEVMEERHITVDGERHEVPRPFVVLATQNPVEMDGTYRLPEAQLDRFMLRIRVGYPDATTESAMLLSEGQGSSVDRVRKVASLREIATMIKTTNQIHVSEAVRDYIVELATATRQLPEVRLGVSPRGSLALMRAARGAAILDNRTFVTADDVKDLAPAVFAHRLLLTPQAELAGTSAVDLVARVLGGVRTPTSADAAAGAR